MKILAIRGENLASLERRFELDLRAGPLGRAGLFAITGPTGAGKSTLLDAICLCLYDKTPRLEKSGGSELRLPGSEASDRLKTNDQRNILRRGAIHGWAEVDFRGRDGREWTARWEVRRSRRRATGRVQNQVLGLRDAQGQTHGGTKTETLREIQRLVGLDFHQFRRSVLLAQGDFAAFLRADVSARADLLEQMTGTDIYSRLSRAAHQRARDLSRTRLKLTAALESQGVRSAEERAAAEAALAEAAEARNAVLARVEAAQAAVRWHQQAAAVDQAVAQAQAELDRAEAAWTAAAPRRRAFDQARRAWPLRDAHARVRALEATARQRRADLDQAARQARDAAQARRAADSALRSLRAAYARACQALADQIDARLRRARKCLQDARAWLDAHPDHRRFDDEHRVAGLEEQLRQRQRLARDLRAASAEHQRAIDRLPTLQARARAAAASAAQADDAVQRQDEAVQTARQAAAAFDMDALASQRATLDEGLGALARIVTLAERARALSQKRDEAVQAMAEAQGGETEGVKRRDALAAEARALQPRLDEARAARDRARAALDATDLRRTLRPGEPCPVCGSAEHPWAAGSPLAELKDELQARVEELQAEQRRLDAELAAVAARIDAARRDRDRARQAIEDADAGLAGLEPAWRDHLRALALPTDLEPSAAAPRLDAARADLDARREALQGQLRAAQAAREALDRARQALDHARQQATAAHRQAAEAEQARATASARVDQLDAALQALKTRHQDVSARLVGALTPVDGQPAAVPGALDMLDDPPALVAALRAAGAEWRRWSTLRQRADDAIGGLSARVAADRLRAEAAGRDIPAEDLAAAPAPTPPPELDPDARTTWLQARVDRLAEQVEGARADARAAEAACTTTNTRLAAAEGAAEQATAEAARARAEADEQARQLGLDDDAVAALAARPDDWLQAEEAHLRSLQEAPARARTLLAERTERRTAHAAHAPQVDASTAEVMLAEAQQARARADDAWSAARAILHADDQARARVVELRQQIAAHDEAATPWLALDSCIGSANGDVFKRFAQSLTLDLLLEQANRHLRDLHPRYSLARIGGTDLDLLVVDHDLGDEPRTIQSLSGGESFLTSLALALALSSLSSHDVRIESLFIDEGFGTLDARTLATALSVLDNLQASGRQVGIISHVEGLAERIGVQVQVEPQGGGRSIVSVVEC